MEHVYDYLTGTVDRGRLGEVREWLAGPARAGAEAIGASLWGAWLGAGSIGWYDDQLVAVLVRPASTPAAGAEWLAGSSGAAGPDPHLERVELVPTVRPTAGDPLEPGGVFAHRWFDVAAGTVDEIVALSEQAWPAFESAFEARIHGLFRAAEPAGRLLLVTRYASVAEWERSRATASAAGGDLGAARANFERRRRLTGRQVVRVASLAW